MPEFSNYVESLTPAPATSGTILVPVSRDGDAQSMTPSQLVAAGGGGGGNFVDKETPSGSINGSNTAFTLANTPVSGSEHIYLNGILLESGGGNDYTISGANITMLSAPQSGDRLKASYRI